MRIIIVDDDYGKAAELSRYISAKHPEAEIQHASTTAAARSLMRQIRFDFAVIDLHLPAQVGHPESKSGGLDLFDMLLLDRKSNFPGHFLFVTAREELIEEARDAVMLRGGSLCNFRPDPASWQPYLEGKLKLVTALTSRANLEPVDVVVVSALRTPELDAFLSLDYSWQDKTGVDEHVSTVVGTVPGDRPLKVLAASAIRMGMANSAALASKFVQLYQPKYLMMVGICAGVEGKVNSGDVIVADPVWDWGSGKHAGLIDGGGVFLQAPHQIALGTHLRSVANKIRRRPDLLSRIRAGWIGPVPQGQFSVHVGPMASGASVIADKTIMEQVKTQHRSVIAVEMEAYATATASEYSALPHPEVMIAKSVCDFGTAEKGDDWQSYAAYTSAAFVDLVLRELTVSSS